MYFIQETDKPNFLFKAFNIIKLKEDKIILPIDGEKIKSQKAEKLAKKTKKIFDKTNSNKVILSKKIKNNEIYKNYLYTYNLNIVEGKKLFEILSNKIIEYVVQKKNMKKEEIYIAILINNLTEDILENIKIIAKEYKRVNIITNHIRQFKKIEDKLLEEDGVLIYVTNNKKKGLSRSHIILNVDFPSELVNEYQIYEEAILINIRGNIKINKKRFNGIIINDYKIEFNNFNEEDYEKKDKYDQKDVYEAQMNLRQPFKYKDILIKKDNVKIIELTGNKTKI